VRKRHNDPTLEWHVRCRRCPGCLRARQYLWQLRAEAEMMLAPQTVMFTGTFRHQTWDIDVCKDAVTRWLKRVRYFLDGEDLRYLVVPERHKSGAWHVHSLMHTDRGVAPSLYRKAWSDGFTYAKVADVTAASYVTKYVSKDLLDDAEGVVPRIRASRSPTYGAWVMERDEEKVKELLASRGDEERFEIWTKNLKHFLRDRNQRLETEMPLALRIQEAIEASCSES
jgi:hypothetical protein